MLDSEKKNKMNLAANKKEEYGAKSIKVLEGLEAVRKRPAMYIGSTNLGGLHHLVYEVVDNSVDEALAGHCNHITVKLLKDGYCSVEDNGRGIPVDIHPTEKISAAEVVLTKLHAGGKFDKDSYKYSGGLHGVGISVVNALSEELSIKIQKNDKIYEQSYKKGKPQGRLQEVGTTDKNGTYVLFKPDTKIFETTEFNFDTLSNRLRELSFLNKGLRIEIEDEISDQKHSFYFEGGIASFVEHINAKKTPIFKEVIQIHKEDDTYLLDFACQYNDGYSERTFSFVNNIRTMEGGTHEAGLKSALTKACNRYAQKANLLKEKDNNLSSDDVREGLVAVLSIKVPEPQFEGQTKTKLGNAEVKGFVDSWIYGFLNTYFEENPNTAKKIIQKALVAQQARSAAKKARELTRRKTVLESSILPGKLADCSNDNPSKTELYLVEGDSAGGCFSGDTEVALLDGRSLSFKGLIKEHEAGKQNYCYTINNEGNIDIGKIKHPRKTKTDAEVIKIVLDNGEEITCTPDHKFMMRDGSYKKAKDLTSKDSLMPLYRKLSKIENRITIKGYEMYLDPKKHKWIFSHLLADKYNLKNDKYSINDGNHKHHINFNKLDNTPENIVRMTKEDHLSLHRSMLKFTVHRDDVKEKCRKIRQSKEFRSKMSAIMSSPKMKAMLSDRAKKQWENEDYKNYMKKRYLSFYNENEEYRIQNNKRINEAQKKYWSDPQNRRKQAERVQKHFEDNQHLISKYSEASKKQWLNPDLLDWRRKKTKEQWTVTFRKKRKEAYNKTYYNNTIAVLKELYEKTETLETYEQERKKRNNKNLLRYNTFCSRFFNGNEQNLVEAVKCHNHKIKKIEKLTNKIDVYDIEVENTHNFALSSGIFVHNSAKQGRDRHTQAILPLRGKIINVEKARLDRMLSNNEVKDLITAIGGGIGNEEFEVDKARYHKIIIMTDADVDGAHIRILLLTFFFRHMLPLIEKGYLYIAQPPLYRVKVGRTSRYLKNDSELINFLFDWAAENTQLTTDKTVLAGENWKKLLESTLNYHREITKLSAVMEITPAFCHELMGFVQKSGWEKGKFEKEEIITKLQTYFAKYEISELKKEEKSAEFAVEGDVIPKPILIFKQLKKTWELPLRFFELEETNVVLGLLDSVALLENNEWEFKLLTKDLKHTGTGILNLKNTIVKTGKSLMTIQRYKGLGEMNPEQLWETTMNPETRTLLKVNIRDAIQADQWFTSLMGDCVSDRREYIEKHAHFVQNLDV